MSKLNPLEKRSMKIDTNDRLAGGAGMASAKQSNIELLRRVTLANLLWEHNAYVDGVEVAQEMAHLIPLCDPKEVARLAIECRKAQKLRHTPLFIAKEMLKHPLHKLYVAHVLPQIITRADMITDFVALYWAEGKRPLPAQAKKGLAKAFDNFNEYQFAKYDRDAAVKLRDVMFLVHPKPAQGKEELYKKIADRNLSTPDTWEVALSTGEDKKETWVRLITEGKIGGLAMLRNIANMMKASVPGHVIKKGLDSLRSAMLLPLDFLKSARMNPEFSREIEDAMKEAYKKLPRLSGRTLFVVDVSGSMGSTTSSGSHFSRMDQACAMAMLAVNQCESYEVVATAGDDWASKGAHEHIQYPKTGFDLFQQIMKTRDRIGGGGIFTRQCMEWCTENVPGDFDRIVIFSDSQDCDRTNKLPRPYGKRNYIIDVSAHRRGVNFKGVWTAEISGWSEHFLTYISACEGLNNTFQQD